MTKIIAVAALMLSLVAVPANGAAAATSGDPVIRAPKAGGSVPSGWTGPVTVDFTNAPAGVFDATLTCNNYTVLRYHTFHNGSGADDDVQNWQMQHPIRGPKSCHIGVTNYSGSHARNPFTVEAPPPPPLKLSHVRVTREIFYPVVHDGYKDSTTINWALNREARVNVNVRHRGHIVRHTGGADDERAGRWYWTWNGRKDNGVKARPGRYFVHVVARAGGVVKRQIREVTVATGYRREKTTLAKWGYGTSSTHHTKYCGVDFDSYENTVQLSCFIGGSADAKYRFALRRGAYDIRWTVYGDVVSGNKRNLRLPGQRVDSRHFLATVEVVRDLSYVVNEVDLTYWRKVRI